MRLWFAAVRPGRLLIAMAFFGVVSGLLHGRQAAVPSITLSSLTNAPLLAVFALIPAVVLLMAVTKVPAHVVVLSVRPVGLASIALITCALMVLYFGAVLTSSWTAGLEAVRNTAGLFGLAVMGRVIMGQAGQLLVPLGFVSLCFLFGKRYGTVAPELWAWLLQDELVLAASIQACILLTIALVFVPRLAALSLRNGQ